MWHIWIWINIVLRRWFWFWCDMCLGPWQMLEHCFGFPNSAFPKLRHAYCYNHNRLCSIREAAASLHVAGTVCKAYSSLGNCDGEHALSFAHFCIWCCHRMLLEEPLVVLENVPEFPAEELKFMLPQYEWSNAVLTPDMLGLPIRRDRIYVVPGA